MPLLRSKLAAWLSAALLVSCSPLPVAPANQLVGPAALGRADGFATRYALLRQAPGQLFNLDPKVSSVRMHVFRAGQAAKLGHNHVLTAADFKGYFFLPPAGTGAASFELEFRLDQLEVDKPSVRSTLGKAYASQLSPEAIASTREHMLGEDNLQALRFPFVRIRSLQIVGEEPIFAVKMAVELHGQSRDLWLPLRVSGLPGSLSVQGSLVLRQSDFGIQPYSVLGGLLAVQDELVVDFTLAGS